MKYILIFLFTFLSALQSFSQTDSLKKLNFSAYGEFYYSYDFSNPQNHEKENFIYNHKRHNEINANLLLLKVNYTDKKYRANIGLMAGNYPHYNLSTEPTWAQYIYEANIGIPIAKRKNIWLDIGVMPSHIGFESAISADCWTLTRSLLAENSPYYETGVKLTYTSNNEKLLLSALYLNGWQKIQKPNYIQKPTFGAQVSYKVSKKMLLNYSNFIGTDKPDTANSFRFFHNFYMQYDDDKFGIIAGFDYGMEKAYTSNYKSWYSPIIIIKKTINKTTRISLRGEYYNDPHQIIVSTSTNHKFQTLGISSNIDYNINSKIKWRIEAKLLQASEKIFSNYSNTNYSLTTNLSFRI